MLCMGHLLRAGAQLCACSVLDTCCGAEVQLCACSVWDTCCGAGAQLCACFVLDTGCGAEVQLCACSDRKSVVEEKSVGYGW